MVFASLLAEFDLRRKRRLGRGLDWRPRLVRQALSGGFDYQPRDDLRMAER